MKCDLESRTELVDRYVRREMSEEEIDRFEIHLLTCEKCFEDVRRTLELSNLIGKEGTVLFPEYVHTSLHRRSHFVGRKRRIMYSILAAAASLLIFFVYRYSLSPDESAVTSRTTRERDSTIVHSTDSTPPTHQRSHESRDGERPRDDRRFPQSLYADNYREVPDLENLIAQVYRGGDNLIIQSPIVGDTVVTSIVFQWHTSRSLALQLTVLTNHESVVFDSTTTGGYVLVDVRAHKMLPGLYYWKLASDDELLHLGKFYVVAP